MEPKIRRHKFKQKGLRNAEISKTKQEAMRDISKDVKEDMNCNRNYTQLEYLVLQLKDYEFEYLNIP